MRALRPAVKLLMRAVWEPRRLPASCRPPYACQIADEEGTSPGSNVKFVYSLLQLHVSHGAHPSPGVRSVPTMWAKL